MKKIYLTIILGILLVGTIFAIGSMISVDMNLTQEEVNNLQEIGVNGISNPEISRCTKINNYTCKARIFEEGGMNKEIKIEYAYCNQWEEFNESADFTNPDCLSWTNLTESQIELEAQSKTNELLKSISNVHGERKDRIETEMSDAIDVTIKKEGVLLK